MASDDLLLTRPFAVADIPPQGADIVVETTEAERRALAKEFGLPAVHSLEATYHLSGTEKRVKVKGQVRATIEQTCVVTLEPFEGSVDEAVDVDFVAASERPEEADPWNEQDERGHGKASREAGLSTKESPDEIVNGTIDLGALTAEFLALGLDPYPRKPGAVFSFEDEAAEESPFARLASLKTKRDEHD